MHNCIVHVCVCLHVQYMCVVCMYESMHCLYMQLQLVGHFTVYALEGRGGEVRWHHTPQDFQMNAAYPTVSHYMCMPLYG